MPVHLTAAQRQLALRLKARGLSLREIGPQVGCSHQGVALIARRSPRRLVRQDRWGPGPGRLTLADREEITLGVHGGESFTVIAARLGKATSTVSREVAANGGRAQYRAWRAHQRAREQARRPKTPKLAHAPLAARVSSWLAEWWSPVQISARLRIEFAGDPMMWVSHETISQALYVQGRGELRRELARCLRTGRAKRRPRGRVQNTGQLRDMVMISQRPPRPPTGPCPATGKATCSSAPTASQPSAPWSSGPPAMSCCCTCPLAVTRTWSSRRCARRSPPCPAS